jgi:calcineurin-like phosphoesterase family protein
MNQFFIADTHFNDKNIIEYTNRPFKSVEEMNCEIIDNWNHALTSNNDIVWVLGDFFIFKDKSDYPDNFKEILKNLAGKIYLIKGNHDIKSDEFYLHHVNWCSSYPVIIENFFMLSHEPLYLSETTPYFNIYGHVHNDSRFVDTKTTMCVSAERIGYTPISMEEVRDSWRRKFM